MAHSEGELMVAFIYFIAQGVMKRSAIGEIVSDLVLFSLTLLFIAAVDDAAHLLIAAVYAAAHLLTAR